MKLDSETLYLQLRRLVASMPDLEGAGPVSPDVYQWLGRAAALVEQTGDLGDLVQLKVSAQSLNSVLREDNAQTIAAIVHRALARAELNAPATAQGAFIAAGDTLNAFAAVAKVLARAKRDVLMVDAYADQTIITDFAVTAPENVSVRILGANKEARKLSMRPAVERWKQQFGAARPLEVRVTQASALHDRLILIDEAEAWSAHQSFNGMAKSSHTSIERSDDELGSAKITAYEAMWNAADPLQ
jgi:hypothetical protein